jgi:hypothetical protein
MKFAYKDEIQLGLIVVGLLAGAVATACMFRDCGWRGTRLWEKALIVAFTPMFVVYNGCVITLHVVINACILVVVGPPVLLINFLFPPKPLPPRLPEKYVPLSQKRTLRDPLEFTVEARRIARNRVVKNMRDKGINPYRVSLPEIKAATTDMLRTDWKSIRADAEMSFHENEILAKIRTIDEYGAAPPSGWGRPSGRRRPGPHRAGEG